MWICGRDIDHPPNQLYHLIIGHFGKKRGGTKVQNRTLVMRLWSAVFPDCTCRLKTRTTTAKRGGSRRREARMGTMAEVGTTIDTMPLPRRFWWLKRII